MQRDPGYLTREKIRILNAAGVAVDPKSIDWTTEKAVNYTLRQDSGAGNSLGTIRIDMPNKHAVYMHDTPSKRLFGADYRFLSHGCVRVQGVYDFAEWLLEGTPAADGSAYDKLALTASIKTGQHFDIRLAKAVPVIWTYLTGWANDDGSAHFRDDVYGLDNAPAPPGPGTLPRRGRPIRKPIPCRCKTASTRSASSTPFPRGARSWAIAAASSIATKNSGRQALDEPAMDRVPVRVQGPPARGVGFWLHRTVLSR